VTGIKELIMTAILIIINIIIVFIINPFYLLFLIKIVLSTCNNLLLKAGSF